MLKEAVHMYSLLLCIRIASETCPFNIHNNTVRKEYFLSRFEGAGD